MNYKKNDALVCRCPLCNAAEATVIQVFQSKDAPCHLGIDKKNKDFKAITLKIEELWKLDKCFFVKCTECSFQFAFPFISGDPEFYSLVYNGTANYPEWKWDFQISSKTITSLIDKEKRPDSTLLEIGAGAGSFVKRMAESLFLAENILTTEFSEFGASKINSYGIKCLRTGLTEMNYSNYKNSFDFVCMFQVLEHMDNLDSLFLTIANLLKKNGHLFITVPNSKHRLRFESSGVIEDVPPVHISRWNRKNFEFIGNKYNLELVDHQIEPAKTIGNALRFIFVKHRNSKLLKLGVFFGNGIAKKLINRLVIAMLLIINFKKIFSLCKTEMGVSQWAHFRKI